MLPPGMTNAEMLERSLDEKTIDTDRLGDPGYDPDREIRDLEEELDIDIAFNVKEREKKRRARLQAQGKVLFNKLYRHVSSVKMGGGDRAPKAQNSSIVVLTVQTGEPPAVRVTPRDSEALLSVGKQPVFYREYLITFGKGQ
jgi:hypothetical protein